jgi:hypothetical protein
MNFGEIIRDLYINLGQVSQDVLGLGVTIPLVYQANAFYNKDLESSDQNWFVQKAEFYPRSMDEEVSGWATQGPFGTQVKVEVRESQGGTPDLDTWLDVPDVNLANLNAMARDGVRACSFYGTPRRVRFSWDVRERPDFMRVWYEPTVPDFTDLSQRPKLPDYYHSMISHRASLKALPHLLTLHGDEVPPAVVAFVKLQSETLRAELSEWEAAFKEWRTTPRQQARTRIPGFHRRRAGYRFC